MNTIALALGTIALAGSAAASGQPVFQWSAGDLSTLESIADTHHRIETTARQYCRDHLRGSRGLRQSVACVKAVTEEIVLSVDDERLTAYARTGTVARELLATR